MTGDIIYEQWACYHCKCLNKWIKTWGSKVLEELHEEYKLNVHTTLKQNIWDSTDLWNSIEIHQTNEHWTHS